MRVHHTPLPLPIIQVSNRHSPLFYRFSLLQTILDLDQLLNLFIILKWLTYMIN